MRLGELIPSGVCPLNHWYLTVALRDSAPVTVHMREYPCPAAGGSPSIMMAGDKGMH